MTISELQGFKPGVKCRVFPTAQAKRFGLNAIGIRFVQYKDGTNLFFTDGTRADAAACEIIYT